MCHPGKKKPSAFGTGGLIYRPRNLVGEVPHDKKKIITHRKSDVGILKSIFDGTSADTKIKLRDIRCLLPAELV